MKILASLSIVASCLLAAATGTSTSQARTAAPAALNMGGVTANEGSSLAFSRADHVHGLSGVLGIVHGGSGASSLSCSVGQAITSNGTIFSCTPLPSTGAGGSMPFATTLRQVAACDVAASAIVNPAFFGSGAWTGLCPTLSGSPTSISTPSGAFNPRLITATTSTSAAAGQGVGIITAPGASVRFQQRWELIGSMSIPVSVTGEIVWVYIGQDINIIGHPVPAPGASGSTTPYLGIGCQGGVNGTRWVLASSDGVTETALDTTVACASNTIYTFDFNCLAGTGVGLGGAATSCSVGINGVYTTKSTNLPGALAGSFGFLFATMQNTATSTPAISVGSYALLEAMQ